MTLTETDRDHSGAISDTDQIHTSPEVEQEIIIYFWCPGAPGLKPHPIPITVHPGDQITNLDSIHCYECDQDATRTPPA